MGGGFLPTAPSFILSKLSTLTRGQYQRLGTTHDDAHNAFMTFPPYTRTREGEAPQLSMARNLPAGPLHEEMPSQKLYKMRR